MGSADWMPRNLDRRVEILFPVEDEALKEQVIHILKVELEDNVKAHILQPDGTYEKEDKRGKVLNKFSGAVLPGGGAAGKGIQGRGRPGSDPDL